MNLILLGPPGAGKGTQAKLLSDKLKLKHISAGDLLRAELKQESDLGKQAKKFIEAGDLVPDRLVTKLIEQEILRQGDSHGFILDGFPRNLTQAQSLDEILQSHNLLIDLVVYLKVSEPVIIQRLSGRRVCKKCFANFHLVNLPPRRVNVCDYCAGELYQRPDDKEETIRNRLKVYLESTASLIDYYQKQKKLLAVNADVDAENVFQVLGKTFQDKKLL